MATADRKASPSGTTSKTRLVECGECNLKVTHQHLPRHFEKHHPGMRAFEAPPSKTASVASFFDPNYQQQQQRQKEEKERKEKEIEDAKAALEEELRIEREHQQQIYELEKKERLKKEEKERQRQLETELEQKKEEEERLRKEEQQKKIEQLQKQSSAEEAPRKEVKSHVVAPELSHAQMPSSSDNKIMEWDFAHSDLDHIIQEVESMDSQPTTTLSNNAPTNKRNRTTNSSPTAEEIERYNKERKDQVISKMWEQLDMLSADDESDEDISPEEHSMMTNMTTLPKSEDGGQAQDVMLLVGPDIVTPQVMEEDNETGWKLREPLEELRVRDEELRAEELRTIEARRMSLLERKKQLAEELAEVEREEKELNRKWEVLSGPRSTVAARTNEPIFGPLADTRIDAAKPVVLQKKRKKLPKKLCTICNTTLCDVHGLKRHLIRIHGLDPDADIGLVEDVVAEHGKNPPWMQVFTKEGKKKTKLD